MPPQHRPNKPPSARSSPGGLSTDAKDVSKMAQPVLSNSHFSSACLFHRRCKIILSCPRLFFRFGQRVPSVFTLRESTLRASGNYWTKIAGFIVMDRLVRWLFPLAAFLAAHSQCTLSAAAARLESEPPVPPAALFGATRMDAAVQQLVQLLPPKLESELKVRSCVSAVGKLCPTWWRFCFFGRSATGCCVEPTFMISSCPKCRNLWRFCAQ